MATYVETRGSALLDDYKFLGAGPATAWWYRRYHAQTTFDHPTVLVERDEQGWRLYVGAIPSSRHDPTGSTNRVTVVAESADAGDRDRDREALVRLVEAWLADVAEHGERVRAALDAVFPGEAVDRLYADDGPVDDVRTRLRAACAGLTASASGIDVPGSWIAPVRGTVGRAAFVARVRALLAGDVVGSAIFVNLVDDADGFARGPDDPPLAVLVTDPAEALDPQPAALPTTGPTTGASPGDALPKARRPIAASAFSRAPSPRLTVTRTLVALAMLALVIGLAWWILIFDHML